MQPEVVKAVEVLVRDGVLTPETAATPMRAARGELLSVAFELRLLLWLGVTLITAGTGILIKQNLDRIGPLAIAIALGVAAIACLAWVASVAPAFSWRAEPSPNLAFDYVLLLGASLVGADLAFVEVKFTPLGSQWPWHLLAVALLYAALAVRFDSRLVFSLALSSFAAWRGLAITIPVLHPTPAALRWNAIACGVLFVAGGWLLAQHDRKAHFEPVAAHMGWLLVLGALGSGMVAHPGNDIWWAWTLVLLITGTALLFSAARARRFWLFAMGVLGTYAAVSRLLVEALADVYLAYLWFLASAIAIIVLLAVSQRRLKEDE